MSELIWKIGFDEKSAERAGKKAGQSQTRESSKTGGKGGGAFGGGFLGGLAGSLLGSVKMLFDPLNAIATLLVASLFPILKPFLILFLKVGLLLNRWLSDSLTGLGTIGEGVSIDEDGIAKAGDGLKSALFLVGAVIAGIIAALAGAPVLLIAAIAIIGGILVSKVGSFFVDTLLGIVQWIDGIFGSNLLAPLKTYFDGISNVFNGLWNTLKSLLTLDFDGVWEGLKQVLTGLWQVLEGIFLFSWEALKLIFTTAWDGLTTLFSSLWDLLKTIVETSFEALKTFGTWIWETLVSILKTSFNVLSGFGTWIKNQIQSMIGFGGFGGSSKSVNDAIITPNGDIIRTSPSDYLIATKNPSNLGMSSNGSSNVNVSINGGLITEDVARQIGRLIQREINYGGGF